MSELALEVKNLSKNFYLKESKDESLKEVFTYFFSSAKKNGMELQALNNLSFKLYKGESMGIIGGNGAGKSTLLKVLSGITDPDEGEINFYGRVVSILDIGAGFHPELTGRENIFLSASLYQFSIDDIHDKFQQIIDFSGVGKFIDEPVKNYSAGMYLRLAFSIITCLDADIYLIDEVINVGDANFQMKCKTRMEDLTSQGKTLLIVSHNLNEVAVLCNRIILLENGTIREEGGLDVIQKYLTLALPDLFLFKEGESFHVKNLNGLLPLERGITVVESGLKEFKKIDGGISNQQAFKVFFDLQLAIDNPIDVRLQFYDSTGLLVFVCNSMTNPNAKVDRKGSYRIEFNIPSNLLNQRMYSVDLTFINLKTLSLIYRVEKFVTIKIADEKLEDNKYVGVSLPGLVKPYIQTSIEKYL